MTYAKKILGVDPGSISGAWALLVDEIAIVGDLPVVDKNISANTFYNMLQRELMPDSAIVELVSAMPGNGVSSMFAFGKSVGLIHASIQCAGIPLHLVPPSKWKKHFNLSRDKEESRALAMRLYPNAAGLDRKKDAGRAEALLLARYYLETKK
jgi:crossover junction endodeoxyribonuclease RuvC